jgi:hypothetical protein
LTALDVTEPPELMSSWLPIMPNIWNQRR